MQDKTNAGWGDQWSCDNYSKFLEERDNMGGKV